MSRTSNSYHCFHGRLNWRRQRARSICVLAILLVVYTGAALAAFNRAAAQQQRPSGQQGGDQPQQRFSEAKRRGDEKLRELSKGVMEMKKFSYKSRADGLEIPA